MIDTTPIAELIAMRARYFQDYTQLRQSGVRWRHLIDLDRTIAALDRAIGDWVSRQPPHSFAITLDEAEARAMQAFEAEHQRDKQSRGEKDGL